MNVIRIQHTLFALATVLFVLLFLSVALSYADGITAPPPPPPISNDVNSDKRAKSSQVIDRKTETKAPRQDKPDEEQQQQYPAPDLTIRYKEGAKIEEYRVNGQLRYAKITPKIGPAYYLIDTDGDGRFDKRHDHLENPPIQQWLLYSW